MLDQIQELMAQQYNARLLLKQAEYKALQAQVNPQSARRAGLEDHLWKIGPQAIKQGIIAQNVFK